MTHFAPIIVLTLSLALALGCGRDAAQVRWDEDFARALEQVEADPAAAETALVALAARAPRGVDEGVARFAVARMRLAQGRTLEGAETLRAIAEHSRRQDDRARAYYELGRLAEDRGRRDTARTIYRALVRTYPDLMPGERALAHLLRMARAESSAAVDAHFRWSHTLVETLAHTGLADDLLFQAAQEAQRRAERSGDPVDWAKTEVMYRRLGDGPRTPLWNDAWWELSWIYHRLGRYADEVAAIETILRTREQISLFGQDEHPYYWDGQLRIARLELVQLADPVKAIDAFLGYIALFPRTIKKDDMRFFALCAALQAGDPRASELRAQLEVEHPDSRWTRAIPEVLADPRGARCTPPEVTR